MCNLSNSIIDLDNKKPSCEDELSFSTYYDTPYIFIYGSAYVECENFSKAKRLLSSYSCINQFRSDTSDQCNKILKNSISDFVDQYLKFV